MREPGRSASEILAHARRSARKQDEFFRGGFHFVAVWDHILESQCAHTTSAGGDTSNDCSVGCSINFNALDALKMVSDNTLPDVQIESSDETIDLERLKRQEPIGFYAQVTLYEDELADHGTAQMSVRLRVMPDFFFVLMRFYLRIDRVLVRVCDTRLLGDNGKDYMIREWSLREAKVADLEHLPPEVLLDGNQVWESLPIVEVRNEIIKPISA
ncbi:TIP41-like family protein [Ancylostoma duodenale]|uniref:TIP41-like protein n=1 Tax=Ancylostoma duodenale TaxID=51022 RepID=A0A0C2CZC6_9BILA|nr:TIP41-like family protein [Ancylostoma duodenale]